MERDTEVKKMIDIYCKNPNKKQKKEYNKKFRHNVKFNTGTRTHKSKKDYNRKKFKKIDFCY